MIFLKILGWVLLGILAFVILALSIKIRVNIEYSHTGTSVFASYLFLRFRLLPLEKKEDTEKSPVADSEKTESAETEENSLNEESPEEDAQNKSSDEETAEMPSENNSDKKPAKTKSSSLDALKTLYEAEGFDGCINLIKRLFAYLGTFGGKLLKGVVVDNFELDMLCTKADAAETAMFYGEICSLVYPMLSAIANRCRVKSMKVDIYPDYVARFNDASFIVDLHFRLIRIIGLAVVLAFKMLFGVIGSAVVKILLTNVRKKSSADENKKNTEEKRVETNE